jgi:mRNA interferase MazF
MRTIASVALDKRRPALVLTRASRLHLLSWVTVAPITSTIRGLTSEVRVGTRNGLDHDCVVSCDNITTVRGDAVHATIGLLFDDQEADLARAISDAFELVLP